LPLPPRDLPVAEPQTRIEETTPHEVGQYNDAPVVAAASPAANPTCETEPAQPPAADHIAPANAPALDIDEEGPVQRSRHAHEISLDVRGKHGETVHVRFHASDVAHVHVDIHATTDALSRELQLHSNDLAARLEDNGYEIRQTPMQTGEADNDPNRERRGRQHPQPDAMPVRKRRAGGHFQSVLQVQER
jgi:hypothetical protein